MLKISRIRVPGDLSDRSGEAQVIDDIHIPSQGIMLDGNHPAGYLAEIISLREACAAETK